MNPRVICGFPGIGKTWAAARLDAWDSDSSAWPRDHSWPDAYVRHVRTRGPLVFCSTHAEVRAALCDAGVPFGVAYPERALLNEYLSRYKNRGSGPAFLRLLAMNWTNWLDQLEAEAPVTERIVLGPGEFLLDALTGSDDPKEDG